MEKIIGKNILSLAGLLILLFMALPIAGQYFNNSFMHESIANAISENPYASSHCLWYSEGECNLFSYPPWSPLYHLVLARFVGLGALGVKLLNSISLFMFFSFVYFMTNKKHPAYLLLFSAGLLARRSPFFSA